MLQAAWNEHIGRAVGHAEQEQREHGDIQIWRVARQAEQHDEQDGCAQRRARRAEAQRDPARERHRDDRARGKGEEGETECTIG
jgi:hypothetical protein